MNFLVLKSQMMLIGWLWRWRLLMDVSAGRQKGRFFALMSLFLFISGWTLLKIIKVLLQRFHLPKESWHLVLSQKMSWLFC